MLFSKPPRRRNEGGLKLFDGVFLEIRITFNHGEVDLGPKARTRCPKLRNIQASQVNAMITMVKMRQS